MQQQHSENEIRNKKYTKNQRRSVDLNLNSLLDFTNHSSLQWEAIFKPDTSSFRS